MYLTAWLHHARLRGSGLCAVQHSMQVGHRLSDFSVELSRETPYARSTMHFAFLELTSEISLFNASRLNYRRFAIDGYGDQHAAEPSLSQNDVQRSQKKKTNYSAEHASHAHATRS